MVSHVQIDESHLVLLVPGDLDDAACDAIQRVMDSKPLLAELRQAIRQVFQLRIS
jgi:hypothetical protein